ncbi:sulfur reduction protein DsrS [Sulfuricystis multivorans]|uniref:sulfur reduction protein DsrS n=1 Tax=Sulfuricystis multivorans TaxID=2211108 RepID=UPI000F842CF0|nr:sulfur reduction protein DsrS [Sulfuricystis multivorans]
MIPTSDPLAPEDALRLNVLLAGEVHAVRIDEGTRTLWALTPKGEARIVLNPIGRAERYFQRVREVLAGHALGSPGGYPVYLRRWTRMGQASEKNLEALLKLGEPEAVLAVAHAAGLTDELARRAWWAGQSLATTELARVMLMHPAVRDGQMGPVLTRHLIDYLPFESDPVAAMQTVRVALAAGLLAPEERLQLWAKAKRRPHYLVGFLEHLPDDLPPEPARPLPQGLPATPVAQLLARCYSGAGQGFLQAAELALDKAPTHEAVYLLLDLVGRYFTAGQDAASLPVPEAEAQALESLARLSQDDAAPILTRTTAVGPLMRRHLEPLLRPIIGHLRVLRGAG